MKLNRFSRSTAYSMLASLLACFLLLWFFAMPSLFIGRPTLLLIQSYEEELAKLARESNCDPDRLRSEIALIAEGLLTDGETTEQFQLGPASSVGDADCFVAVVSGYDSVFFYSLTRKCWHFDRWRLGSLPQCKPF
ncbi:MAG: hypothetical protein ACRC14_19130 [Paracoccaceae bacterium]